MPTPPEPVTPEPARRVGRWPVSTQSWRDLTFLHWEVDPDAVARLLPAGTVPDVTGDGRCYLGLVAFEMRDVGMLGLPAPPWLGTFPETNLRVYSVDRHGRRGVVFASLDAARLVPVLIGLLAFRLPYRWSRMAVRWDGDEVSYTSVRRWPGPRGAASRLRVRVGGPVTEPTPLEHFLTARWGLHTAPFGRPVHLPNEHPRWPLRRAELLDCAEDLVHATGLPVPAGPPVSVLYSPGVRVRFGRPVPAT